MQYCLFSIELCVLTINTVPKTMQLQVQRIIPCSPASRGVQLQRLLESSHRSCTLSRSGVGGCHTGVAPNVT